MTEASKNKARSLYAQGFSLRYIGKVVKRHHSNVKRVIDEEYKKRREKESVEWKEKTGYRKKYSKEYYYNHLEKLRKYQLDWYYRNKLK
jgi:hypothetical protein